MLKFEQYKKLTTELKEEYDWRFKGYTYDSFKRSNTSIIFVLSITMFLFAGYLLIEKGQISEVKTLMSTARILIMLNIYLIIGGLFYDMVVAIIYYVNYKNWKKKNNIG